MHLIQSIVAADMWCGCALIVEGHGSGPMLFTRRAIISALLLAIFLTLVESACSLLQKQRTDMWRRLREAQPPVVGSVWVLGVFCVPPTPVCRCLSAIFWTMVAPTLERTTVCYLLYETHTAYQIYARVMVCVYLIGIPAFLASLFAHDRRGNNWINLEGSIIAA